jgi:hypothetical protein
MIRSSTKSQDPRNSLLSIKNESHDEPPATRRPFQKARNNEEIAKTVIQRCPFITPTVLPKPNPQDMFASGATLPILPSRPKLSKYPSYQ